MDSNPKDKNANSNESNATMNSSMTAEKGEGGQRASRPGRRRGFWELAAYGFSMGTANVIPGVSGGTMALIHGIYEDLVDAINSADAKFIKDIMTFRWKSAFDRLHWRFLLPLGVGVVLAILSLARVIPYLLEHYRPPVTAFFLGLILASTGTIAKEIPRWTPGVFLAGLSAALISFWVVGLIPLQTPESLWFLFLCGVLAIMAMLLPGISGAFILLVLGKYTYVLGAIQDLVYHLQFSAFLPLAVFAVGCVVGLVALARAMAYALEHHRGVTMAILVGLMLGSVRKLWPWREVVRTLKVGHKTLPLEEANRLPMQFDGQVALVLVTFVLGIALVILLERLAQPRERTEQPVDRVA